MISNLNLYYSPCDRKCVYGSGVSITQAEHVDGRQQQKLELVTNYGKKQKTTNAAPDSVSELGGSWVVISMVIRSLTWVIAIVTLLVTPLITTHEPPSKPQPQSIEARLPRPHKDAETLNPHPPNPSTRHPRKAQAPKHQEPVNGKQPFFALASGRRGIAQCERLNSVCMNGINPKPFFYARTCIVCRQRSSRAETLFCLSRDCNALSPESLQPFLP